MNRRQGRQARENACDQVTFGFSLAGSGATFFNFFNQSQSVVKQNQSTFDTQFENLSSKRAVIG